MKKALTWKARMSKSGSLAMAYAARRAAGAPRSTSASTEPTEAALTDVVARIMAKRSKATPEPTDDMDDLLEPEMELEEEPVVDPKEARRALIASIVAKQRD
jgi:ATP adenylyltransferase/5',5'''-P-1,P-4-tetraphosphate phosphorylase II